MMNMMEKLVTEVSGIIGEEYEVKATTVVKNNSTEKHGLLMKEQGEIAALTVYVDSLLEAIEDQVMTITEAAERIAKSYEECRAKQPDICLDKLHDRDFALANVEYRLVNAERNAGMLQKVPHSKFLNLAVIYRVILKKDAEETTSYVLSNEMVQMLGVSTEELEEAAAENTRAVGFETFSLAGLLGLGEDDGAAPMYVLTNSRRQDGANILLFPEELKKVADVLDSDLWIVPSSIHEVLALPMTVCEKEEIDKMIQEVNDTQVEAEEVLGYAAYRYSRENGKLEMA